MDKKTLAHSIDIQAPRETVWKILLEDETYRKWVGVFMEGSWAEGDWSEGSTIRFKGPDGNGLVSTVVEHKPNEVVRLEHRGMILDGKEDFESEDVKSWAGFSESYRVDAEGDNTRLSILMDAAPKEAEWFASKWDEALVLVKKLSEEA